MKNEITPAEIELLANAQLKHTHIMSAETLDNMSDDSLDYMHAALDMSTRIIEIFRDATDPSFCKRAIRAANKLLTPDSLDNFACDGICQEIYDFVQKRYPETDMQA